MKMQKIHLAKVENCKDQKSQSYLDAHHFVDRNLQVSIFTFFRQMSFTESGLHLL